LFYGLRYHTHIGKPRQDGIYHYWRRYPLGGPSSLSCIHRSAERRGGKAMAFGRPARDARSFGLVATRGGQTNGICSNPVLEPAFKTVEYRITVTIGESTWSYDEDTVLMIRGKSEPFHHTDRNTLTKIAEPTPNPLARG